MADEKKIPGSDTLGIIFKNPKPKPDESATSPMAELYGRSLSSISDPNKRDIRAFNLENAFSEKTLEEGTIVSDRRKDRPGFFENVGAAFSEWQRKTFGSLRKASTDDSGKKRPSAKPLERDVTVIAPLPQTKEPTPRIEKMRVMQHDLDAHTAVSATPKKDSASGLQKIRTFKSDAALLQDSPESKRSPNATPKPEPIAQPVPMPPKEKAPEPKPEMKQPIKRDPAPQILKKDVRLSAPDAHAAMVAPEVSMRLQTDAASFIPRGKREDPEKKHVPEKDPVRTYVPHIPDTIARKEEGSAVKKIEPTPVQKTEPLKERAEAPQWTHTLHDAKTDGGQTPDLVPPVLTPAPRPPVKPEPALRESATPILPHEIRSIESTQPSRETERERITSAAPANLPVGEDMVPEQEPVIPVKQPREAIPPEEPALKTDARDHLERGTKTTFHGDETVHAHIGETKATPPPIVRNEPIPKAPHRGADHPVRFMIRMVLALIGVGTLIVLGAMFFTQDEPASPADANPPTSPIGSTPDTATTPAEDSRHIMLSEDPRMFLTAIARAVEEAPAGLTYLEVYTGEPLRDATAQEFFGHLETTFMPRAIRALHAEFIIGSITTTRNEPFILIRSDNFDALFAGLLAWEPSMRQELAPLFGTAPTEDAAFSDAVRNNKSIRILRDRDGGEMLLYSFINERTVIITASSDALAQLIGRF